MPSHHWMLNFSVDADDIEYLTSLLLEREIPLSSAALARALIERKLNQEIEKIQAQFKDTRVYSPAESYQTGQRVVFPIFDYAIGTVEAVRAGDNPEYGDFNVISVAFEGGSGNGATTREFASNLQIPHKLSQAAEDNEALLLGDAAQADPDEILAEDYEEIVGAVDKALREQADLISVAGTWFPEDLLLEVNEGHLHLADAVLDLAQGGPLDAETILEQIGGLGDAPHELQVFSLHHFLNLDDRFDEVGPAGQVLWYLTRLAPEQVANTPQLLRYTPRPYDRTVLSPDMLALEADICDELSDIEYDEAAKLSTTLTLIYPHRRVGTLPLNARLSSVFPHGHRTDYVWITLVDGQDGEEYDGWVVVKDRYVYGLADMYRKHKLPVGAYVHVRRGDEPDKIVVNFDSYRARTEWIRLITPKNGQIAFENQKRSIGAEYDDLMIVGADDVSAVDELYASTSNKDLISILRVMIAELGRLSPQGTVHARTLYSTVNIVRRCPPGPIFATLVSEPDFETVGNHYWKLTSSS